MTDISLQNCCPAPRRSMWSRLADYRALARQRRELRDLDPELLSDIGLTNEAAREEANRPFWDAPAHWRR